MATGRTFELVLLLLACLWSSAHAQLFSAYLANHADFNGVSTNSETQMKFTDVAENVGGAFQMDADGTLHLLKSGPVQCQATADLRVQNVNWATLKLKLNGEVYSQPVVGLSSYGDPDQWQAYLSYTVAAGSNITVTANPYEISNIGIYKTKGATLSCIYVPTAETYTATYTALSGSNYVYGNTVQNTNTNIFQPAGDGRVTIAQEGIVTVWAILTYRCLNDNSYCSVYTEAAGVEPISRFMKAHTGSDSRRQSYAIVSTAHYTAGQTFRAYVHTGGADYQTGPQSVLTMMWTPIDTARNSTDFTSRRYNNEAELQGSGGYRNIEWKSALQTDVLNAGAIAVNQNGGQIQFQRTGFVSIQYHIAVNAQSVSSYGNMRLLRDGVEVAGAVCPDQHNDWDQFQISWHAYVTPGTEFEFQLIPNEQTNVIGPGSWEMLNVFWTDAFSIYGVCYNGTTNDPEVMLPTPTLQPPAFSNNNYVFGFSFDERFERVRIEFGPESDNNPCNYDSDSWDQYWTIESDQVCTSTATMSRSAQDMLATCAFSRSDAATEATFTKRVNVITNQTRSVTYQQSFRNFNYQQIKTSHYTLTVVVPKTVTASLSNVDVTGNITTLQAVQSVAVDVEVDPYHLKFDVITSSQAPYQLEYLNFTAVSTDLADTTTVATPLPDCLGSSPGDSCTQTFTFDAIDITTGCETKTALANDVVELFFSVRCKSSFTGNCITPEPAVVGMTFSLSSTQYCPQIEYVVLSATMETYKDVNLNDATWDAGSKSSQFVLGSTVFGQIDVSVAENAATTSSTTLRTLKTYGQTEVVVYDSGTSVATPKDDGFTGSDSSTRFSVVLTNGESVALDPVADAAQSVVFSAVVDVTFTTTSSWDNPITQAWKAEHNSQTRRIHVTRDTQQTAPASSIISVGAVGENAAAGSPSSSSSFMSSTVVVAVGAVAALAVVAAAYRVGVRRPLPEDDIDDKDDTPMMTSDLSKSASSASLTAEV